MSGLCPLVGRPTRSEETPYSRGEYRIVRCVETGFVYLENPPNYDEVRDDFPWEVTAEAERTRRQQAEPIVSRLSAAAKRLKQRLFPTRNRMFALAQRAARTLGANRSLRLLDIGCGCGGLATECCERFAREGRQVEPVGIELSQGLAEAADRRFQRWSGRVIADAALNGLDAIDERSVDVAMMASFLEHDPKPLELLRALRPRLSDDGVAIIKVPNFDSLNRKVRGARWCGFRFPDHVNYFTPKTLSILAAEAGYRVEPAALADRSPLSDNMYAVLRRAA